VRRLLEWLLGLDAIRLGGPGTLGLRWQSPLPAWATIVLLAILVIAVVWVYRREGGGRRGRLIGGVLRCSLLLLVAGLVFQPVLVLRRERIEPSDVVLLVDVSASMGVCDRSSAATTTASTRSATSTRAPVTTAPGGASRMEGLVSALTEDNGRRLRALAARNRFLGYDFSDQARAQVSTVGGESLESVRAWLSRLRPVGVSTDLLGAVRHVLSEPRTGRLSGIVLASDGRQTSGGDVDDVVRLAREAGVSIHTVLLGSADARRDIVVGPTMAEETVLVRDPLAVRTQMSAEGYDRPVPLQVELLSEEGQVLDRRAVTLDPNARDTVVELRHRPEQAGLLRMRVRVEPKGGEANVNNNADLVQVNVIEHKLHVLYVEGYPRFEYRYLKNLLVREETLSAACLLLSADEGFVQEGTEPVRRFPDSLEELRSYDVVVFGDVDPRADWLSDRQSETLVRWVGELGGGFVMIAGPRWSPQAFLGTPLERLIPVRIDPLLGEDGETLRTTTYRLRPTVEGKRSAVFRFDADPNAGASVVANLPGMYWYARTQGARPGAEVLAEHATVKSVEGPMPLLVSGRYGAGVTVFSAFEETWRWRRDVGSVFFDPYWIQVLRHAARDRLLNRDRRLRLHAHRSRYDVGEVVVLSLVVRDASEAAAWPERVFAEVSDAKGQSVVRVPLTRIGKGADTYEGSLAASSAGSFVVRAESPMAAGSGAPASVTIRVDSGGVELRRPEADPALLRLLAEKTGGLAEAPERIDRIAERLLDRSVHIPDDISEPLWDTRLVLILFVLIIGVEWVLRKASGMA